MKRVLLGLGSNKSFDNKEVLKNVNIKLTGGKIIGLLGKNGAGKTTLIKLINDLLTPTSGEILVKGKPIGVESKKRISYLPERTYLNKQMKVSEVLDFFKDFYDTSYKDFIISSVTVTAFGKDAEKRKCVTLDVCVRAESLRSFLEKNGVIRKLGF